MINYRINRKIKAFTLIEMTMAIGLLAMSLSITGGILLSVVKNFQKQSALREVERNGDFVIKLLEENIRKSSYVYVDPSNYMLLHISGVSGSHFDGKYIGFVDDLGTPNCNGNDNYMFNTLDSLTGYSDNSNKITNDNSDGVFIDPDTFEIQVLDQFTPTQVFVRIIMHSCADPTVSKDFQTFVTARGTY